MAADKLLRTEEVAELLQCSAKYVRTLIHRGELPAIKIGDTGKTVTYRVAAADVRAWISARQVSAP